MGSSPRTGSYHFSFLLLVTLGINHHHAHASPGDNDPTFRACVFACSIHHCIHTHDHSTTCTPVCSSDTTQSLYRSGIAWLFPWTCEQECRYQCMWRAVPGAGADTSTHMHPSSSTNVVHKYYGKWPFVRIAGAQEPAAVVFSIANFVAHVIGLHWLRATVLHPHPKGTHPKGTHPKGTMGTAACTAALYKVQGWLACMSWLAAAVFHTRDTLVTEFIDYFFADAVVFVALCTAMLRVWAIPRASIMRGGVIITTFLILFARHWYYMTYILFDYGFNMQVCLTLGAANACVWLAWVWRVQHPARRHLTTWFATLFACMALEVFDFAPWYWVLDAHALWHACTVVLTLQWYRGFVCVDVLWVRG